MGKGRPNIKRQALMVKVLNEAYVLLRKEIPLEFPTWKAITERANAYKEICGSSEGKIGDKTLLQSKNAEITALRERIIQEREQFHHLKNQIPLKLTACAERLKSSLEANVLLTQNLEQLEKTIENKNYTISELYIRIEERDNEIRRLRNIMNDTMDKSLIK